MARQISRAESWERAHEIFTQVNFNSFDFNTIKESLLDYLKLYFAEDFNDYIESSEFLAILELFAYIGELLAYRIDLNAHENFISTAQRKESILRLAKLISYKASRNIPARGLVKISSVQTTETILDSVGRDISNRKIIWNDNNNTDWKEQFLLIMNRVLEQDYGSVSPNERVQVDDVLFELYSWNNSPLSTNGKSVFSYSATTAGTNYPMELVPVTLTDSGPEEKRPEINAKFSLLYATDGLGDSSDTTGFLLFTKQGTLLSKQMNFDGVTPNQTVDLDMENVNETDVWINNVNSDSRQILEEDPYAEILPHMVSEDLRYGEWVEVDLANAQNIIFNTNKNRHKYEIETLDNDDVRLVFGDGEFSDVPSGSFDVWYRVSINEDIAIPQSSVVDQTATFSYVGSVGNVQTCTFTFSLISSLLNGSPSEDIEHIRRVAPSVYYTQDRMVNGRDYNMFMLQDPSISKLRSINRTYAGDSKYISWHDPRENYENVKLFGDDLALYWNEQDPDIGGLTVVSSPLPSNRLLSVYIEPLLSTADFFSALGPRLEEIGSNPGDMRREFVSDVYEFTTTGPDNEIDAIIEALNNATTTTPIIDLWYSVIYDEWTVDPHPCDSPPGPGGCTRGLADSIWMIRVEAQFEGSNLSGWDLRWRTTRLISQSEQTKFWESNESTALIEFDSLNSQMDKIIILKANFNADETGLLDSNHNFSVLNQETIEQNLPDAGLPDIHRLSVLPEDTNEDGISDNLLQPTLFDLDFEQEYSLYSPVNDIVTLPMGRTYLVGHEDEDMQVYVQLGGTGPYIPYTFADSNIEQPTTNIDIIVDEVKFTGVGEPIPDTGDIVKFVFRDYVYFSRSTIIEDWAPTLISDEIKILYLLDDGVLEIDRLYKRHPGRYPLNFAWFHFTPRLHLVDPSATNIVDMYVVTSGYYTALKQWLENKTDVQPTEPSPLDLRTTYNSLLDNKMISDTVILHSGVFKPLFGSRAAPELRATFKVIRPALTKLTDNEVKVRIVEIIRSFFDISGWEFGETFFFTELAASIHAELGPEIDSIVLVPTHANNLFGNMFQVNSRENELFAPDISTSDINIVQSYTPENIRQYS